jgi:hypothetical protein
LTVTSGSGGSSQLTTEAGTYVFTNIHGTSDVAIGFEAMSSPPAAGEATFHVPAGSWIALAFADGVDLFFGTLTLAASVTLGVTRY